jgi:hypothetical protein
MRSLQGVPFPTTPSAPLKEASRLLLDVASIPPISGGEWRTHSFSHVHKPQQKRFRRFGTAYYASFHNPAETVPDFDDEQSSDYDANPVKVQLSP